MVEFLEGESVAAQAAYALALEREAGLRPPIRRGSAACTEPESPVRGPEG